MDCDEQHEPERIPDFLKAIRTDKWDIISGSRYMESRPDNDLPPGDRRAIKCHDDRCDQRSIWLEADRFLLWI